MWSRKHPATRPGCREFARDIAPRRIDLFELAGHRPDAALDRPDHCVHSSREARRELVGIALGIVLQALRRRLVRHI
jgi:hypothetical protein